MAKRETSEHYKLVPTGLVENLRFRRNLVLMAAGQRRIQQDLWKMCARDLLFWFNVFVWTKDQRLAPQGMANHPFITYPFQNHALLTLSKAIGHHDLVIEKSRDMGASWMALGAFAHKWLFYPDHSFLMVSRNESYVDQIGNEKALYWKIEYILDHLPRWMVPAFDRKKLHLLNRDNGSLISGETTTGDVGVGDRRTCVLLDEFGAFDIDAGKRAISGTRDVTLSRIFLSTPKPQGFAFKEMRDKCRHVLRLHWSEHPGKNRGLYHTEDGELAIDDITYTHSPGYRFILDGKLRSPWYDAECERCVNVQEVAQELDIDYGGAQHRFFRVEVIEALAEKATVPFACGELVHDHNASPQRFMETLNGHLILWVTLDQYGRPPADRSYGVGVDVAVGTGASNSAISVVDYSTGEKVAEYLNPYIDSTDLALLAVALCRWFKGVTGPAFLIWEANGQGRQFGMEVLKLDHPRIYYRTAEETTSRKVTDTPGWWTSIPSKRMLFDEYARALYRHDYNNRSKAALNECLNYIITKTGAIEHNQAIAYTTMDPSGARANHGDIVIADALAWWSMRDLATNDTDEKTGNIIPVGCYQWRMDRLEDQRRKEALW